MSKLFKWISTLEGISLLLLFFVAMPLKYIAGKPEMVSSVGMAHGILFVAYIILAYLIKDEQKWNSKTLLIVILASILPFGTFYAEKKYLNTQV